MKPIFGPLRSDALDLLRGIVPDRRLRLVGVLAVWLLVAHGGMLLDMAAPPAGRLVSISLWVNLAAWASWILVITPATLSLAHRSTFDPGSRLAAMGRLSAGCVAATFLVLLVGSLANVAADPTIPLAEIGTVLRHFGVHEAVYFSLAFWFLVVVENAVRFYRADVRRRNEERRLRAELVESQLARLRAQLHPHFLFNSLNAVASLIESRENDRAYDLIADLGALLRRTLEVGPRQFVPLEEELGYLQTYVDLFGARSGNDVHCDVDVPLAARRIAVPNQILQPIIENALKHGGVSASGIRQVRLRARVVEDRMQIRVQNPRAANSRSRALGTGFGLRATRERLSLLYGNRHSLRLVLDPDGTALLTLEMPVLPCDETHGVDIEHEEDPDRDRRRRAAGAEAHCPPALGGS